MWRSLLKTCLSLAPILGAYPAAAQTVIRGGGVTGTTLNVATLQTGNVLSVTPAVSADRRYVGMAVDAQFSTLDGIDTFVLNSPNGTGVGPIIGGAGTSRSSSIKSSAFRPAQQGRVTFVDTDKTPLTTHVAALTLKNVSVKQAVQKLADASKQNMVLGIRGFEQAGVNLNTPHDFVLPAGAVKQSLLAIVHAAMPDMDIVITSEDKVITVATQAQADQVLITKTYYLDDLLANVPRFVAGGTNLNDIGTPPGPPPMTDFSSAVDVSKPPEEQAYAAPPPRPQPTRGTNIVEVIAETVRPEVWRNHGGKGEISQVGDKVIIRAPASVHALLDGPKVHNPNQAPIYVNRGG